MVGCALDPGRELGKDIVAGDSGLGMYRVQRGITGSKLYLNLTLNTYSGGDKVDSR